MISRALAPEIQETLSKSWEPIYRSQLHYLVTWSTRGRRPVLKDRHARALIDQLAAVCEERGYALLESAIGQDHVHVLLAMRPSQSVSSVIRELKGRSAHVLLADFPELRVWLRGNLLWDERYAVETVSAVRVQRVQERLRALHAPAHVDEYRLARAS
jgi:putative transposase